MLKKAIFIVSLGLILAGCQTTDPYTGETQTNKTSVGAGTGAIVGGIIGALANGKNGALAGAALGSAAGGTWGHYQDKQQNALRAELQGTGVSVKRQGNEITLIMPGDITFDSSKAILKPSFEPILDSVAKVIAKFDKTQVLIKGYTDSSGGPSINNPLSQARANTVFHYLASKGVAGSRMNPEGYGAANPIASNKTPEGRAQNRRVEIHLIEAQQ